MQEPQDVNLPLCGLRSALGRLPPPPHPQVVCPPESRHCYSEKIAYMPHCYFVNDYKQAHKVGHCGGLAGWGCGGLLW